MLTKISMQNYHLIPTELRQCNMWELEDYKHVEDPIFYNELWAMEILMSWGTYALGLECNDEIRSIAVFAPPRFLPKSATMSAGPVSDDAVLFTRIQDINQKELSPLELYEYHNILMDGVIEHLQHRGVKAIECFATKEIDAHKHECRCSRPCFSDIAFLENHNFTLLRDDENYPLYRLEIQEGFEWKRAVENALIELFNDLESADENKKIMLV